MSSTIALLSSMKIAGGGGGGFTVLGTTSANGSSSGATTASQDTTGANFIVIGIGKTGSPTVSDSKSNTWTALTDNGQDRIYYCENPTVGSGHTFDVNGASTYSTIHVLWASGAAASSSFDVQNANSDTSASFNTLTTGSITPSVNGELLIVMSANDSSGNATSITDSFTLMTAQPFTGGVNYGARMAYLIQGSAAAINPTVTFTGNCGMYLSIAGFKPA